MSRNAIFIGEKELITIVLTVPDVTYPWRSPCRINLLRCRRWMQRVTAIVFCFLFDALTFWHHESEPFCSPLPPHQRGPRTAYGNPFSPCTDVPGYSPIRCIINGYDGNTLANLYRISRVHPAGRTSRRIKMHQRLSRAFTEWLIRRNIPLCVGFREFLSTENRCNPWTCRGCNKHIRTWCRR